MLHTYLDIFRMPLQLHAFNETESLGENLDGISPLAFRDCESGPGLFQNSVCLVAQLGLLSFPSQNRVIEWFVL